MFTKFFGNFELIKNLWIGLDKSKKSLFVENELVHFWTFIERLETGNVIIRLCCLNPYYTFKSIIALKPHSLIITSGTLSPIDIYE